MSEPTLRQTAEAWQLIEDVAERAFGMIPPSTPIQDAQDECSADERAQIDHRKPPHDGVRIYGDLLVVRALLEKNAKEKDRAG